MKENTILLKKEEISSLLNQQELLKEWFQLEIQETPDFISEEKDTYRKANEDHFLDFKKRPIINDLSEKRDDWTRLQRVLPNKQLRSLGSTLWLDEEELRTRKWFRLRKLQWMMMMMQSSHKYQELARVIATLSQFFNDVQLTRIQEYLTRLPMRFHDGDPTRVAFILACLDLELEQHGYTILRCELLKQINSSLEISLTKSDILKAKWKILKNDQQLRKAHLKDRLKKGKIYQRMIALNLLTELITKNDRLQQLLDQWKMKTITFKQSVMTVFDAYLDRHGSGWIRDIEKVILTCIEIVLKTTRVTKTARYKSFLWLPSIFQPHLNYLKNLSRKIINTIGDFDDIVKLLQDTTMIAKMRDDRTGNVSIRRKNANPRKEIRPQLRISSSLTSSQNAHFNTPARSLSPKIAKKASLLAAQKLPLSERARKPFRCSNRNPRSTSIRKQGKKRTSSSAQRPNKLLLIQR